MKTIYVWKRRSLTSGLVWTASCEGLQTCEGQSMFEAVGCFLITNAQSMNVRVLLDEPPPEEK